MRLEFNYVRPGIGVDDGDRLYRERYEVRTFSLKEKRFTSHRRVGYD